RSTRRLLPVTAPSTSEFHPLSLHDALPIWIHAQLLRVEAEPRKLQLLDGDRSRRIRLPRNVDEALLAVGDERIDLLRAHVQCSRSEEHTSELQSRGHLVCRLLLEKKKE